MRRIDVLWTLAFRELVDRLRNRWVWTVSFLLVVSALAIALFGSAPVGMTGMRGGQAALASLMNLSVYLVPLLALVLGSSAVMDEKRRGTLDLVLTYPLYPGEYLIGTFLGYCLALFVALLGSYVPVGIVLHLVAGVDLAELQVLIDLVLLLGAVFLAISFLISILAREQGRGMASGVLVWIVSVFLYDLILVGLLILLPGRIPAALFGSLLLLNPTDVFRLVCFHWVGSVASPLGLSTVMLPIPAPVVLAVLMAWLLVPLWVSVRVFRRRVALDSLL